MDRNGDDFITSEILSRLPVRSLMRFKCVCKRWRSIIHRDQFFVDTHLKRSIAARRTSFLLPIVRRSNRMYLLSAELLIPSSEEDGSAQIGTTCLWEPPIPRGHAVSVCTLNGLICFMDTDSSCARVYNSSTRDSTLWIKSILKQHQDKIVEEKTFQDYGFISLKEEKELNFVKHEFGYDPATKDYKVLALWELYRYGYPTSVFFWEVMTVGQNSWRRIEGIDPSVISPRATTSSVYLNGSIYLICRHRYGGFLALSIVEFSVGSEKFRLVETLGRYYTAPYLWSTEIIEVNGRLCVLTYNTQQDPTFKSINMCTLYVHGDDQVVHDKKGKMITNSNPHWVEENITLPHLVELNSIRHIPETDLFIIRSRDHGFSFYDYNKKNYNFSNINSEISNLLEHENGNVRYCFGL